MISTLAASPDVDEAYRLGVSGVISPGGGLRRDLPCTVSILQEAVLYIYEVEDVPVELSPSLPEPLEHEGFMMIEVKMKLLESLGDGSCTRTRLLGMLTVAHQGLPAMPLSQVKAILEEMCLNVFGKAVRVLELGAGEGEGLPDNLTVREAGFATGTMLAADCVDCPE